MRYLLLFLCAVAGAETVDGTGVLIAQEGTATADGKPITLKGMFKSGAKVATAEKSTASVFLSTGSKILMTPNSVVHFKVVKQVAGSEQTPPEDGKSQKELGASITEIEVESGKVIGDVKKLAKESVFTLKTPVGTVSIKGTVFSVEFVKNKDGTVSFNVGCLVGRVAVQMADPSAKPMAIGAGQKLSVSANPEAKGENGKPPPPPKMEIAPMPPAEMKVMAANSSQPPPPAFAPPPPPKGPDASKMDAAIQKVVDEIEHSVNKQQVNPSPTGG